MDATGLRKDSEDFSVVLGGPLYQIVRRAHLSGDALELLRRRILFFTLVTWLPLLVLSVLGIAAFTLVFQGRSRYLLIYVPVVVALWAVLRPVGWRPGRRRTRTAGHAEPASAGRAG